MDKVQRIDNNELYAKYVGQRKNGKPDGHGKGIAHDGGVYEGEWKDGVYDGQGTYILPGGEKYEGEWKDGLKHGHGILTYSNGEMLVGDFVMDHPFIFSSLDKDEPPTLTMNYRGTDIEALKVKQVLKVKEVSLLKIVT